MGWNACPGWLVTTAMAVVASLKTMAPEVSESGIQSGGAVMRQRPLESSTGFPASCCARSGGDGRKE